MEKKLLVLLKGQEGIWRVLHEYSLPTDPYTGNVVKQISQNSIYPYYLDLCNLMEILR